MTCARRCSARTEVSGGSSAVRNAGRALDGMGAVRLAWSRVGNPARAHLSAAKPGPVAGPRSEEGVES